MEKERKELNINELKQVSGGLRTEYLNPEELATYLRLKEASDKAWYPSEITAAWDAMIAFKVKMKEKNGNDIVSDEWEEVMKKLGL